MVAVTGKAVKARLGELARLNSMGMGQPYIDEAPLLMLWVSDMSRTRAFGLAEGKDPVIVDHIDTYDDIMGAHYAARGTKPTGWRQIVARITMDANYLDGRQNLRQLMRDRDIKML